MTRLLSKIWPGRLSHPPSWPGHLFSRIGLVSTQLHDVVKVAFAAQRVELPSDIRSIAEGSVVA